MPIIKSAIKKLRKDKKRTLINKGREHALRDALRKVVKTKSTQSLIKAVRLIDKAAKTHLIHKNKAARLKGRLAKLIGKKSPITEKSTHKPTRQKPSKKVKNSS